MAKIRLPLTQKLLITCIVTFAFIFAKKHGKSFHLAELNEDNFNITLSKNDFVLITYYTTDCGPCETFLTDFEYAGRTTIRNQPPILFAKINCAEEKSHTLCYDITNIPAVKFYKFGRYSDDFKIRKRENIALYAAKMVKPDVERIYTKREFVNYLASTNYAVIGMFFDSTSELMSAYMNVTNLMYQRFDYAWTSSKEIMNYQKVSKGIVVYKPDYMRNEFEEDYSVYNSIPDLDKIKRFLLKNFHGLVGFKRPENRDEFHSPLVTVFYDFNFKDDYEESKRVRRTFVEVANEFRGLTKFAMSRTSDWPGLLENMGFSHLNETRHKPIVTAVDANERKYVMDGEYTTETLKRFLTGFLGKSLTPYIRSGETPVENNGVFFEAVARNLEEVAFSGDRDTFLYIYDPDCGVCQMIKPQIEKLGKALQNDDVFLCRINGVINDLPKLVKPVAYPTIYYLRKNRKHKPIMHFGGTHFLDLIRFIAKHSSEDLKNFDRNGKRKELRMEL